MIEIQVPAGGTTPALVQSDGDGTGVICATGTAARDGDALEDVYAKIYAPDQTPDPTPPADAAVATLTSATDWEFVNPSPVPSAQCAAAAPYPSNKLRVWATYQGGGDPDIADVTFLGRCSTQTDCD